MASTMPSSASLRNPLIMSVPAKVRDAVGVDVVVVGSDVGLVVCGGSRSRMSRRSRGAEDREPEVPKRD